MKNKQKTFYTELLKCLITALLILEISYFIKITIESPKHSQDVRNRAEINCDYVPLLNGEYITCLSKQIEKICKDEYLDLKVCGRSELINECEKWK